MNPYMMHPNDECYCDEGSANNPREPAELTKGIHLNVVLKKHQNISNITVYLFKFVRIVI